MGLLGDIVNAFEVPKKSKRSAYASLFFLGLLGWHEFYLGKKLRGFIYIVGFAVLMIGWSGKFIELLAYIGSGILLVFWVFDLFTLWKQVNKWNELNARNTLIEAAGKAAGDIISIPLNNAVEEYNSIVENFQQAIKQFKKRKNRVKRLLVRLQQARKNAASVISRLQTIIARVRPQEREAIFDELGDKGQLPESIKAALSGNNKIFEGINATIDNTAEEMKATFYAAEEYTQEFESNAGKFAAVATTAVITGLIEYSKQQAKIAEIKQKRMKILEQQNEIEIKIRQLEATEIRATEILKVIEGEMPGFDHIYDTFCAAVFPNGILEQKEMISLTIEQRKLLKDLSEAAKKVMIAGSQEIN